MLMKAFESDSTTTWWIKGDGADVTKGLGMFTRGEWSGDVDLNDGVLNCLYQECKDRLKLAAEIGLRECGIQQSLNHDLKKSMEQLSDDLKFIHKGKHCVLLSLATLLLYNLHTLELQKVSST